MQISPQIKRRKPLRLISEFSQHLHPVLSRVYSQRLLDDPAHIDYQLAQLSPAQQLSGLQPAIDRLVEAIKQQQRILIVGDFDADGATSTAVCMLMLRGLGAQQVGYLVPNRFDFGYGLSPELVELAATESQYQPDVIITVDNGISSLAGVKRANDHGIDVIITDHHLPGAELPAATAIVNPNVADDNFPSKHLAGVGVAFYLMAALRSALQQLNPETTYPKPAEYLDLVALGTVADVVRLDYNNRILVSQGLARIRAGRCRPGITALLQVSGREPESITASDLGFAVGPRLNAAGRIDDISVGIECLLADALPTALPYARQLDELNRQRRSMQADMQTEALKHVAQIPSITDSYGVCVYQPDWHAGIVGLVAGKLKEQLHRPVIAFADEAEDSLKGSARSIPGVHIRDVLERVSSQNPQMVTKFGGHAMAAGLSLPKSQLEAFQQAFDAAVQAVVQPEQLQQVIYTDGDLRADEFTLETATSLKQAGPWGQGFPEPLFDGVFTVRQSRIVGEQHIKLKLQLQQDSNASIDAIWFFAPETYLAELPAMGSVWHVAYKLDVNHYMGKSSVQLIVETMLAGTGAYSQ